MPLSSSSLVGLSLLWLSDLALLGASTKYFSSCTYQNQLKEPILFHPYGVYLRADLAAVGAGLGDLTCQHFQFSHCHDY